jgi:hypothetical protein
MGAPCGTAGQLPVSGVPMGAARPPVEEKFARPPTHPPTRHCGGTGAVVHQRQLAKGATALTGGSGLARIEFSTAGCSRAGTSTRPSGCLCGSKATRFDDVKVG